MTTDLDFNRVIELELRGQDYRKPNEEKSFPYDFSIKGEVGGDVLLLQYNDLPVWVECSIPEFLPCIFFKNSSCRYIGLNREKSVLYDRNNVIIEPEVIKRPARVSLFCMIKNKPEQEAYKAVLYGCLDKVGDKPYIEDYHLKEINLHDIDIILGFAPEKKTHTIPVYDIPFIGISNETIDYLDKFKDK